MLSFKDLSTVYETVLASPGMNDVVKINLKIPRRNVLLLSKAIELGLSVKEGESVGLLNTANIQTIEEIKNVSAQLLSKADLSETNDRLNSLSAK